MSGIGHSTAATVVTGDARIDGILHSEYWADATLTYSFPTSSAEYDDDYGGGEEAGLFTASSAMRAVVAYGLDADAGSSADDGFSVEGFTNLTVEVFTEAKAHIRLAQTTSDPFDYGTAWSYFPFGGLDESGDVWLSDVSYDFSNPRAGNYPYLTILHEMGHSLGLEHSHDSGSFGLVPTEYDAMEYTIMSYKSYPGTSSEFYINEKWGYAQSYMMLDIAALQQLYGADFSTNSGDTVYSWTPDSGQTLVDGAAAIDPGDNRIFATIWDGGGTDTYDLSAYDSDLEIDLAPGAASVFSFSQLARLGDGERAGGNIYNALLYRGDTRSLIENVLGGAGNDILLGNEADNRLQGNAGDDELSGLDGDDTLIGKTGADILLGGSGADLAKGGAGADTLLGELGRDTLLGGLGRDMLYGKKGVDRIEGEAGNDRLFGGTGEDVLIGGAGRDAMTGGADRDSFVFASCDDSPADALRPDRIRDFTGGEDRIDLGDLFAGTLSFIGAAAFSGTAGELRSEIAGETTLLSADCDGDGTADFVVELLGAMTLTAEDFIL